MALIRRDAAPWRFSFGVSARFSCSPDEALAKSGNGFRAFRKRSMRATAASGLRPPAGYGGLGLRARARRDRVVPAPQMDAPLRNRDLDPFGEIHRHQGGDVGNAEGGAAHERALSKGVLHG